MAEQERKTKAERRAESRESRRREAEDAARRKKKDSARNAVITVAVVAVIAVVAIPAVMGLFGGDADVTITQEARLEAFNEAGCELVAADSPSGAEHIDRATAPPADVLYADQPVRPVHSGPHYGDLAPPSSGIPSNPLDEVLLTHNLEHGAVIVWVDRDVLDSGTLSAIESWLRERHAMGFTNPRSGGSTFGSHYPGLGAERPVAFRAWGQAVDCAEWNATVADGFLIDNYGSHGISHEGGLTPYPSGTLGFADEDENGDPDDDGDDADDADQQDDADVDADE